MVDVVPVLDPGAWWPSAHVADMPAMAAPLPPPPDPGPGDPEVPLPAAVPRQFGRRCTLIAARALSHAPLTDMGTARVESWDDPFGLEASTIHATLSEEDPAWSLLGAESAILAGRRRWRFPDDDGQLEWQVWDEHKLVASGVTGPPVAVEGGGVSLVARGPESVLEPRAVGAGGTDDRLEGRGSFPTTSLTGWEITALTHSWNTTDPFDGDRALDLTGYGTVATPWVSIAGAPTRWQDVRVAAMIQLPGTPAGAIIDCQVRLPDGTPVRPDLTTAGKGAATPDADDPDWQQIVGTAGLPPHTGTYRVRAVLTTVSTEAVVADRLTVTQDHHTGSIDPLELSDFPARILTAAQEPESGGWLGIALRKRSNTGVLRRFSWSHATNPIVMEMLKVIAETPGGPDLWCDAGWTLNVAARQGRDRRDLAITDDLLLTAPITYDPAARDRDLLVQTGWGAGPTRAVIGFEAPYSPGRRRRRRITYAPPELPFQGAEKWGEAQHAHANQRHRQVDATVRYALGQRVATGDGLITAASHGLLAEWGAARVANRTFYPLAETCTLALADDPVVML